MPGIPQCACKPKYFSVARNSRNWLALHIYKSASAHYVTSLPRDHVIDALGIHVFRIGHRGF